jgi:hypothetical protein
MRSDRSGIGRTVPTRPFDVEWRLWLAEERAYTCYLMEVTGGWGDRRSSSTGSSALDGRMTAARREDGLDAGCRSTARLSVRVLGGFTRRGGSGLVALPRSADAARPRANDAERVSRRLTAPEEPARGGGLSSALLKAKRIQLGHRWQLCHAPANALEDGIDCRSGVCLVELKGSSGPGGRESVQRVYSLFTAVTEPARRWDQAMTDRDGAGSSLFRCDEEPHPRPRPVSWVDAHRDAGIAPHVSHPAENVRPRFRSGFNGSCVPIDADRNESRDSSHARAQRGSESDGCGAEQVAVEHGSDG